MELQFELPVGLHYNGKVHKDVVLLPLNGVAEKVIIKKGQDSPYRWQANVLSVAVKSIGDISIASKCREDLSKTGEFTVPDAIEHLSLADTNTLLVEIHRRLWEDILPEQEFICKFCSKKLRSTVDLKKISFTDEDKEFLTKGYDLSKVCVYLPIGFFIDDMRELSDDNYAAYKGLLFNKLTFSQPALRHAIMHEKYANDSLAFWRRIAFETLESVECVEHGDTPEEKLLADLPNSATKFLGIKLYDFYLNSKDLKSIREELQDFLPTLPYFYEDECPACNNMTPFVMEASNFFSA